MIKYALTFTFFLFFSCSGNPRNERFQRMNTEPHKSEFLGEWIVISQSYDALNEIFDVDIKRNTKLYLKEDGTFLLSDAPAIFAFTTTNPTLYFKADGIYKFMNPEKNWNLILEIDMNKAEGCIKFGGAYFLILHRESDSKLLLKHMRADGEYIVFEKAKENEL